jgi:hypothetical protein
MNMVRNGKKLQMIGKITKRKFSLFSGMNYWSPSDLPPSSSGFFASFLPRASSSSKNNVTNLM